MTHEEHMELIMRPIIINKVVQGGHIASGGPTTLTLDYKSSERPMQTTSGR